MTAASIITATGVADNPAALMNMEHLKLPLPIQNDTFRDMQITARVGDDFVTISVPTGGRITVINASPQMKLDLKFAKLDEVMPPSETHLRIDGDSN